jgi:hypothetical protein
MLKTDNGWQLIGVQSSAPAAKDRWRADNRALSVTGFRDKLEALAQGKPARMRGKRLPGYQASFIMTIPASSNISPIQPLLFNRWPKVPNRRQGGGDTKTAPQRIGHRKIDTFDRLRQGAERPRTAAIDIRP